jgi:hypothetical protein
MLRNTLRLVHIKDKTNKKEEKKNILRSSDESRRNCW